MRSPSPSKTPHRVKITPLPVVFAPEQVQAVVIEPLPLTGEERESQKESK